MEKSVFSKEYAIFLSLLRKARKAAEITQEELAKRLGQTQSFVSKCERGERRMDVVELHAFCRALNISFHRFSTALERALPR